MALDTNPNANMMTPQTSAGGQQPYTAVNGMASLVKAMMDGNAKYKAGQGAAGGLGASPLSSGSMVPGAAGPSSVGGAMGPAPLVDPNALQGASPLGGAPSPGMAPPVGGPPPGATPGPGIQSPPMPMSQAFPTGGTNPMSMDPVTQALMSPIPGMTNG